MHRRVARKAWAAAVGLSLGVHLLIGLSLVYEWNSGRSPPPSPPIEVSLERPRRPTPAPERPLPSSSIARPKPAAIATPARPADPAPRTVAAEPSSNAGRAQPDAGVDLKALAYPAVRGCAEETLDAIIAGRRRDCDPRPVLAQDQSPKQRVSMTEAEYPPPSTPEWEQAAARRKTRRDYRECGNFFSCGDLNKCPKAGKNRAAGCDTYPGLGALVGRIFGD